MGIVARLRGESIIFRESIMIHAVSRPIVLRLQRETVTLVGAATMTTLALSYSVHAHRPVDRAQPLQEGWIGDLASIPAAPVDQRAAEPITSASLVVPKSELALPPMPIPTRTLIRLHGCEGSACVAKLSIAQTPRRQRMAIGDQLALAERTALMPPEIIPPRPKPSSEKPGFMSRMNPLKYLPDSTTIKRPVSYVGNTVSGWFKRF